MTVSAAVALTLSCAKTDDPEPGLGPTPARKAIIVKSLTGVSFSQNTRIGLFVKNPNYENVLLTVGADGKVSTSEGLYWNPGQTEKTSVVAYTPYQEGVTTASGLTFSVSKDQSTEASLEASDLVVATLEADPAQESISLDFYHQMSQICIYFDNRTGDKIASVTFGDLYLTQKFDVWSGNGRVYNPGQVRAFASSDCYLAFFPSQTVALTVSVTMVGGDTYEFEVESNSYAAGKSYSNSAKPIKIEKASKPMSLSFSISDWVDGGQLTIKEDLPATPEDTPFTRTSVPGFYSNTTTAPVSSLAIEDQEQYSYGCTKEGRVLSVADFGTGMYKIFNLNATELEIGSKYSAVLDENGDKTSFASLACVNLTSSLVWLEDKSQGVGFIIPVE